MKFFTRFSRLTRMTFILLRYNIDGLFFQNSHNLAIKWLLYFNPYYWRTRNRLTRGERIRLALQELGPIFVKIGQIISTRRDIIPEDIAYDLAMLQDQVPPFSGKIAKRTIERTLNKKIEQVFAKFDLQPLASASIAQVHAATLLTGEDVVVKVLRPNIEKIIMRDIDILTIFANTLEKYFVLARAFKPREIVAEISQTLVDELDLTREGANATQLRRNFAQSELLYIPKIYWHYSRQNILVIERIYGISIHDKAALLAAKIDLNKLAQRGLEIFFTQIFRDSFFHADLHPGNIFASPNNPDNPSFIAVDFGIVGSLSHSDQRYLAENMIAFFNRDYQRVAELHIACGWLSPDTRIDQFEGAIRAVSEPIFAQPLKEISFGQLLMRLFQVARRFEINIQPQLVLLQKTIVSIEGISRTLAPDLDLWATAEPQIRKWLKKQIGVKAFVKRIKQNIPIWSEQFPELPSLIHEVLRETKYRQELTRFNASRKELIGKKVVKRSSWGYFLLGVASTAAVVLIKQYVG